MNFLFIDKGDNTKGSTRIWVHNLAHWLNRIGDTCEINYCTKPPDFILLGKSTSKKDIAETKTKHPKAIIGVINPSANNANQQCNADFYLVGSIEEQDYWMKHSYNTFIFPLIERIFSKQKKHCEKDTITLGYHGNLHHLNEFYPNLTHALNKLKDDLRIELKVIYDTNLGRWIKGRPSIPIKVVNWELSSIEDELLECDIGLCPGIIPETNIFFSRGIYNRRKHDYLLRFKNKTNAGRAFVFHQLGIPVVGAFIPSHFQIMGDGLAGRLAHHWQGWYNHIHELASSVELRIMMATIAKSRFENFYNPLDWTRRLRSQLCDIMQKG